LCLCSQPSLTERTVDDHRQLPARYGAMGSALRGRLAAVLLHHVGGHDHDPKGAEGASGLSGLTTRQLAVLEAVRRGKANKIIAYELNMCESTVKVHLRNIMKKLRARNRTEAAFMIHEAMGQRA